MIYVKSFLQKLQFGKVFVAIFFGVETNGTFLKIPLDALRMIDNTLLLI